MRPQQPSTRPTTLADAPSILAVAAAVDEARWGDVEVELEEVEDDLRALPDLAASARVATVDGAIVGSVVVRDDGSTELLVAPTLDPPTRRAVEDVLLAFGLAAGGTTFDHPVQDEACAAAMARHGLVPAWSSFELERPPASIGPAGPPPDGVVVRPLRRPDDEAAVHAAIYAVWTQVPGHHDRDLDSWRQLFLDPPRALDDLHVVAWAGERPVGVALCRTYPPSTGWISQLAVADEARGQGLGRWLLAEASARLAAVPGLTDVGLSVQARNERALGLYRSAGFVVTREWVTRTPGGEPATPETSAADAP